MSIYCEMPHWRTEPKGDVSHPGKNHMHSRNGVACLRNRISLAVLRAAWRCMNVIGGVTTRRAFDLGAWWTLMQVFVRPRLPRSDPAAT
jgi:hypothetical protein